MSDNHASTLSSKAFVIPEPELTPYLTCQRCNCVSFIDVNRVRPKGADFSTSDVSTYEQLPVCIGCGSTKYLRAGIVSFQGQIEAARKAAKEFERKRIPATALLQRMARGFLGRKEYQRRLRAKKRRERRIYLAATCIQSYIRGVQARRRSIIERCLSIIRRVHPKLLSYAISRSYPSDKEVFWYKNQSELRVLFWNYREFVRRSGGRPTLLKVETNIIEITKRILQREYVLVSRIQAAWRSLTTRLVFLEFRRQQGWYRSIRQSPAIRIQRLFRGHTARKKCSALQAVRNYPVYQQQYKDHRRVIANAKLSKEHRARLIASYRRDYQFDKTKRMLYPHSHEQRVVTKVSTQNQLPSKDAHEDHPTYSLKDKAHATDLTHRFSQLTVHSEKFLEAKRQVERVKSRKLRGPQLHIRKAKQYALPNAPEEIT